MKCMLCPRLCGVDRQAGETGFCGAPPLPVVARAARHDWEEPCISGSRGSGAVFFSGCNLGCVYCQNREISRGGGGEEISAQRLADIFRELEEQGAANINLVTPDHWVPQIRAALELYRPEIPVLFNCSGYESPEMLEQLEGLGQLSVQNLLNGISESRKLLPHQILGSIGIPNIGRRIMEKICHNVNILGNLTNLDELIGVMNSISGIGLKITKMIIEGIKQKREIIKHQINEKDTFTTHKW